jgi:hypothetical protein
MSGPSLSRWRWRLISRLAPGARPETQGGTHHAQAQPSSGVGRFCVEGEQALRRGALFFFFGGGGLRARGEDSPFFALLGSAPQELNNIRPEAKLECWELRARNPNMFFIPLLLSRHSIGE